MQVISDFLDFAKQEGYEFEELPLDFKIKKQKKNDSFQTVGVYRCGHSLVVLAIKPVEPELGTGEKPVYVSVFTEKHVSSNVQLGRKGLESCGKCPYLCPETFPKVIKMVKDRNDMVEVELNATKDNPFQKTPPGVTVMPCPFNKGSFSVALVRKKMSEQEVNQLLEFLSQCQPIE